ncbi:MAG: phytanoyl-CoA dioxygenase family protein [Acidobacteria bacterium]|nr:phytanoyl-CoA dioxygenase family protein [Acidobacteriota bacterium]
MKKAIDLEAAIRHLDQEGYVVLEGLLDRKRLQRIRGEVDRLFEQEQRQPFDPGDGPEGPDDDAIQAFISESYTASSAEVARIMKRIRHTRALNGNTSWPVPPNQVMKLFFHLPLLFDQDRSQRIMNLPAKSDAALRLVEEPHILRLVRGVLGDDCVLSDLSATSIGAHATEGGAWHVDVPLGQLAEPLPDFPLTVQNAWMLDDFTAENGATRVVPRSHKLRKKPVWAPQQEHQEAVLTAPAGSVAVWLSNTWHRSGPNTTGRPRRALLGYYSRSWVKPFSDYRTCFSERTLAGLSPTLRYLLGFSANAIVRG